MRRAEYRGGREDPGGSCGQVAVPRPAWGQGHYRPPRWWPGAQPVPPGVWSWSAAFRFVLPENREQNPLLPGRPAGPCGPVILRPEEPGSRFWLKLLSEDCALAQVCGACPAGRDGPAAGRGPALCRGHRPRPSMEAHARQVAGLGVKPRQSGSAAGSLPLSRGLGRVPGEVAPGLAGLPLPPASSPTCVSLR